MTKPHRILIVEDELALTEIVRDYFSQASMEVEILNDGGVAANKILSGNFDLVVLDLILPIRDGISICPEVRTQSQIPIIMATAKVAEIDRLLGLELGADDYLCKPYSPRELVARTKAVLRRFDVQVSRQISRHRLQLDEDKWRVVLDGVLMNFTRREIQLLACLKNRPGRVFSRAQLLDMAFSDDTDVYDRTVDSHIKNLRQKLAKVSKGYDPIRSVYGVGYSFEE